MSQSRQTFTHFKQEIFAVCFAARGEEDKRDAWCPRRRNGRRVLARRHAQPIDLHLLLPALLNRSAVRAIIIAHMR